MILINGLGERRDAQEALPPLQDIRVEKVARILCIHRCYNPDSKESGGVCLYDFIQDKNLWYVERSIDPDGSDHWSWMWMFYIENALQILEALEEVNTNEHRNKVR